MEWSISRDPEIFIDPDAWNPMRWLDPSFPTYQEPLSKHPTITSYSQFGYGQRVCQGQGVVDADLFVGIGSVAWLFSMQLPFDDSSIVEPMPHSASSSTVPSERDDSSRRSSFSQASDASTMPSLVDDEVENADTRKIEMAHEPSHLPIETPSHLGNVPELIVEAVQPMQTDRLLKKAQVPAHEVYDCTLPQEKSEVDDPTMDFTTLLIAKPRPFKFELSIRNQDRAEQVARRWTEQKMDGEFEDPRVYWKDGVQGDAEFG
jgi:hypothetical protein